MKKLSAVQIKTIAFLIVAVLLLGITVISENIRVKPKNTEDDISVNYSANTVPSQESTETSPNEEAIYTVKEHEGAIAVFKQGVLLPVMRQKVAVSTLPEDDKRLLKNGVEFATYRDMLFFLENYE